MSVGTIIKDAKVSNYYRNAIGDRFSEGNATSGCDAVDVSGALTGLIAITGHCVLDDV